MVLLKNSFAWGLRVGFLTFGLNNNVAKEVLEAKVKGLIRVIFQVDQCLLKVLLNTF